MSKVRQRLKTAGVTLPEAPKPVAAYVPAVKVGNLVFISGQVPLREGTLTAVGSVPSAVSPAQAAEAARQCVINALAVLSTMVDGELDQVRRIVRVGVFVASDPGFDGQPQVANGASELLLEVFGDAGRHARAAVGMVSLPIGLAVEIHMVVEVE